MYRIWNKKTFSPNIEIVVDTWNYIVYNELRFKKEDKPMEIKLSDDLQIITDDLQFILQERRVVQDSKFTKPENVGNEYWENIGYHPNVKYAMNQVVKNILLKNDDLKVIINLLNELDIKIDEIRSQLRNTRI